MNVNNLIPTYFDQRPVYIINSSDEFIRIATAEAARCLGISSEEFTEIAPTKILKRINQIFSEVFFTHQINQIFENFFQKKRVVEFDLSLKLNSIIYSLTYQITQELSSFNIFSYKQLVDRSTCLSLLKREAETCYLSKPTNYTRRAKIELSLWESSEISSFDRQIISQFFLELKENHSIQTLMTLKENTKAYAEYCVNLYNTVQSKFNKARPTSFSRDQKLFYTRLHNALMNSMSDELKLLSKESKNYLGIKKFYILKSIFYFKMRIYFTNEYKKNLANKNETVNFLKKLLQIKINGCTYLIADFENLLKEIDRIPFQDLIQEQKEFINTLRIRREKLQYKLITNSDNDWLKSKKNMFHFDLDIIHELQSILETLPTSQFEEKFIRQLNVLYGCDFIYPEEKTSFLIPDMHLNLDLSAKPVKKLVKMIESRDHNCLNKTISIVEID